MIRAWNVLSSESSSSALDGVLARAEQRPDQGGELGQLVLSIEEPRDPARLLAQPVQLILALVREQPLELELELFASERAADPGASPRRTHVVQEPARPRAQIEAGAQERRVPRRRPGAAPAVQDEPGEPGHARGVRAKEDRALLAGGSGLERRAIDDHRPREHARRDVPGAPTQHVGQRLVEVLGVEAPAHMPDLARTKQLAYRLRGGGRREEDLALRLQRKTRLSTHPDPACTKK
jgi:hypothetical protein